MGSTNKTAHYELPQFVANDKPSWLGDVNQAMEAIDTGIYGAKSSADGAQTTANNAVAGVQTANTRMDGMQTQLDTVATQANQTATAVNQHTSSIATNSANINTLNSRMGNTDISDIGDGTVTGAIEAISGGGGGGSSNVRWNATTDRFEVLKNGSWVQSIRAFVNSIAVWLNGIFGLSYSQNKNPLDSVYTLASQFTVSGNQIIVPNITANNYAIGMLFEGVDMPNYSTMKVKTNITGSEEITVNVSGTSGTCYPYIVAFQNQAGVKRIRIGVSTINNDEYAITQNTPAYEDVTVSDFSTVRITEITLE